MNIHSVAGTWSSTGADNGIAHSGIGTSDEHGHGLIQSRVRIS